MKYKGIFINILILALLLTPFKAFSFGDLELRSIKIEYLDDKTNPKKSVTRILDRYADNSFYSKPKRVNIIIQAKNIGDKTIRFKLNPELYFLVEAYKETPYSLNDEYKELKSISSLPVWVWNSSHFVLGAPIKLEANMEKTILVEGFNLESLTQISKEYQKIGFAIRVFTSIYPMNSDKNLKNNLVEKVFYLTK